VSGPATALWLSLVIAACGGSPSPAPSPAPEPAATEEPAATGNAIANQANEPSLPRGEGKPSVAPPFSAEQIRDATHPGRRYLFSVQDAGQPAVRYQIDFLSRTETDTRYRVTVFNAAGQEVSRKERTETWEQLENHAHFPVDGTRMQEQTFTVPAGTYEGYLYETTDAAAGLVTRLYFAADLPGAAAKVEVLSKGKVMRTMTLLEHRPGTPEPE
jgi:hypothetical protein